MGRPRSRLYEALNDELLRNRRAFVQALGSTNRELLTTLSDTYGRRLTNINRRIDQAVRELPTNPSPDDRAVIATLEDMQRDITRELNLMRDVLNDAGRQAQAQGAAEGFSAGVRMLERGGLDVTFGLPEVNTIQRGVNIVESPAFQDAVGRFGAYHGQVISDELMAGIQQGVNPRVTANRIQAALGKKNAMPMVDAVRLTRTTQLYAARLGQRDLFKSFGDRVTGWIWSANLGNPRTCIGCIVQHGTFHPVTEVLNDHHSGRCAPSPVTPKWVDLGYVDAIENEPETLGITWFAQQPPDVQRQYMGSARWIAWKEDRFRLADIVTTYDDPIYGQMRRPAQLNQLVTNRRSHRRLVNMARHGTFEDGDIFHEFLTTAREITPDMIENGRVRGVWFDTMVDFFAYDSRGNPIYHADRIEDKSTDFFYRLWGLGKGDHAYRMAGEIRREAASILGAYEQSGSQFLSRREINHLKRLSSADENVVYNEIDNIRDRRFQWRVGGGGTGGPSDETLRWRKAVGREGAERLREANFGNVLRQDDYNNWDTLDLIID